MLEVQRPELAQELRRLADRDLTMRERLSAAGELEAGYHPEMRAVHHQNGQRLAAILAETACWPGYRMVGAQGSHDAFLIAQHDIANPSLLRLTRKLYTAAVSSSDADPQLLAKIEDRIRYFEGRLQRYGTHWGWDTHGEFGPWPPVEEPDVVDERRAELGLGPLSDAIKLAAVGRPRRRPVSEVEASHRSAEAFAHEAGWRA